MLGRNERRVVIGLKPENVRKEKTERYDRDDPGGGGFEIAQALAVSQRRARQPQQQEQRPVFGQNRQTLKDSGHHRPQDTSGLEGPDEGVSGDGPKRNEDRVV